MIHRKASHALLIACLLLCILTIHPVGLCAADAQIVSGGWIAEAFANTSANSASEFFPGLPFSFTYGEKPWADQRANWTFSHQSNGPSKRLLEWKDPQTGLVITCELRTFADFPAADWLVWFENKGKTNTPIIDGIRSLDIPLKGKFPYQIHALKGCDGSDDDLLPIELSVADEKSSAALGCPVSSSNPHLPFFNIETGDSNGVLVGLGWSGPWNCHFTPEGDSLRISAGIKNSHFYLKPGEKIRAMRVLLLPWKGEIEAARNQFRRLLYKHYLPGINGKPHYPLVTYNSCFAYDARGFLLEKADEKNVQPLVQPAIDLGAEAFIIDAGWYEGNYDPGQNWYQWTGNWRYSREKYPNGFKSIADLLAKHGAYFGLWFGPEAVSKETPVAREHPEWLFLQPQGGQYAGISFSTAEAREWFLKQVDEIVKTQGLNLYRNDTCISVFPQPPDRVGFHECAHYGGLYKVWDALRIRHPDMVFEGCMGGAQRIDLETFRRFSWHQKSDTMYHTEANQAAVYGANLVFPGGVINLPTAATDDYGCWSSFGGQLMMGFDVTNSKFPHEKARQQVELYKKIRHLLSGDFHPLTPCSRKTPWIAYQFHRPDLDAGIVMIFRRPKGEASDLKFTAKPAFLDVSAKYKVHAQSAGTDRAISGADMLAGIEVQMQAAPGAELLIYQR